MSERNDGSSGGGTRNKVSGKDKKCKRKEWGSSKGSRRNEESRSEDIEREWVANRRRVSAKGKEGVYAKEWKVKDGNNSVISWCTGSRT